MGLILIVLQPPSLKPVNVSFWCAVLAVHSIHRGHIRHFAQQLSRALRQLRLPAHPHSLSYTCTADCCIGADVVMVNSSWTAAHIRQLWWMWNEPHLVYPPCDTTDLQSLPLDRRLKHLFLVSIAQFRPEKNHRLQLEAYALAREVAGGIHYTPLHASSIRWCVPMGCYSHPYQPV